MPSRSWVNPYIDLVGTKPLYLIPCKELKCTQGDIAALQSRCTSYAYIYCELGSGSGGHLIELALRNPATLCVGFELNYKRAFRTAEKAERFSLENLLVMRTDARCAPQCFAKESLEAVFVNFPDPWDKRRWYKHRLLTADFLAALWQLLRPGGSFSYKTDHAQYFSETVSLLVESRNFEIAALSADLLHSPLICHNISTEFEGLFAAKGAPVQYILAKKLAVPGVLGV